MTFDDLIFKIESFEGFREKRYFDSVGIPTIGFGFTSQVFPNRIVPSTISREESEVILRDVVSRLQQDVANYMVVKCGYELNLNQLYALTSFTYNCGMGNLQKLTNNGKRDLKTIGDKILLYNKANGKVLKGLTIRRQWEHDCYFKLISENIKPVQHTAQELQIEVNRITGKDTLEVDGKIGNKSINAIYEILHSL